MSEKAKNELSFEQGLERLEKIVQELEKGDLALERALELFEEGMKLSANCRKKLEEAENRVEILLKKIDGKMAAEPFRIGENEPGKCLSLPRHPYRQTLPHLLPPIWSSSASALTAAWSSWFPPKPRRRPRSTAPCATACLRAASVCARFFVWKLPGCFQGSRTLILRPSPPHWS